MESLESDLLPRDTRPQAFDVRLHRFDASVERALRDLERRQEVRARDEWTPVVADIDIAAPPEKVWEDGDGGPPPFLHAGSRFTGK